MTQHDTMYLASPADVFTNPAQTYEYWSLKQAKSGPPNTNSGMVLFRVVRLGGFHSDSLSLLSSWIVCANRPLSFPRCRDLTGALRWSLSARQ